MALFVATLVVLLDYTGVLQLQQPLYFLDREPDPTCPEDMSMEHVFSHANYLWDMRVLDLMRKGDMDALRALLPEFIEATGAEIKAGGLFWMLSAMGFPKKPARVHGYWSVIGTGNAVDATFTCSVGSASQQARGRADLKAWNNALLGTSEKKGTANVGALIDARGCVTTTGGEYVISVAWQGLQPTTPPPAVYTCGLNAYTNENLRRVVAITMRIADLSAP